MKKNKTEQPKATRQTLLDAAYELDPSLKKKENEAARDAILLLLGAWVDGPQRANKTAKIPEYRRRKYMTNLKQNGVFEGNVIHASWDDPENGSMELLLHANVALGFLECVKDQK